MTKRDLTETELGAVFAAQRQAAPPPSEAFLARIAADAEAAAQAGRRMSAPPRPARRSRAGWHWLASLLAPAGVVSAGLLGVWIGVTGPQTLPDPALLWTAPEEFSAVQGDALYVFGGFESWETSYGD